MFIHFTLALMFDKIFGKKLQFIRICSERNTKDEAWKYYLFILVVFYWHRTPLHMTFISYQKEHFICKLGCKTVCLCGAVRRVVYACFMIEPEATYNLRCKL